MESNSAEVAATLVAVIDRLRRAVLLLDDERRVLFANAAARRELTEGDAFRETDGRLEIRAPVPMERMQAYLDKKGPEARDAQRLLLTLERFNGQPAYRMLLMRLEADLCPGSQACHLMMVFDPHAARAVEREVLLGLYDLTPAEAEIAAQLFSGLTVNGVAAALGSSPRTVRAHLRSIFRKCEVESQAQLLQLLALGPRNL
jgi:DNA-binding CsgD family transcriptional regulator